MAKEINIKDAFETLEEEKEEEKEDRKEENYKAVVEKTNLGRLLGFAPTMAVILFYLVIPLVWTSMNSLSSLMQNL